MKSNMSITDRWVRVVLAIIMAGLVFTSTVNGTWAVVLLVLAGIFLVTSMVKFCPLYVPFGISTFRKKDKA